jgi:hypothetical protein
VMMIACVHLAIYQQQLQLELSEARSLASPARAGGTIREVGKASPSQYESHPQMQGHSLPPSGWLALCGLGPLRVNLCNALGQGQDEYLYLWILLYVLFLNHKFRYVEGKNTVVGLVQCRSHNLALCSKNHFLDLMDKTVHAKVQAILACCFCNLRATSLFTSKQYVDITGI